MTFVLLQLLLLSSIQLDFYFSLTVVTEERSEDEIDLQIGLYYLALEQRYHQSLRKLSLIYLRTGEKISFDASSNHKQRVEEVIGELAWQLRTDCKWEPKPGEQCVSEA